MASSVNKRVYTLNLTPSTSCHVSQYFGRLGDMFLPARAPYRLLSTDKRQEPAHLPRRRNGTSRRGLRHNMSDGNENDRLGELAPNMTTPSLHRPNQHSRASLVYLSCWCESRAMARLVKRAKSFYSAMPVVAGSPETSTCVCGKSDCPFGKCGAYLHSNYIVCLVPRRGQHESSVPSLRNSLAG